MSVPGVTTVRIYDSLTTYHWQHFYSSIYVTCLSFLVVFWPLQGCSIYPALVVCWWCLCKIAIDVISVQYLSRLSNVASGSDSQSSYYVFTDIYFSQCRYARDRTKPTGHPSQQHTVFNTSICTSAYLTSTFGMFKDWIIICMIALSNNNQWTVEWYMCLTDNTHQFHVIHDFRFSSKRPVRIKNIFFVSAVIF